MKKKLLHIAIGLTFSFCLVSVVAALPPNVVSFALENMGQKQTIVNYHMNANTRTLKAGFSKSGNGTIGLSLDKMTIHGWSFVSRCNLAVNTNTVSKTCSYGKQSAGGYQGTIVINTTNSGEYVGYIELN